MTVGRIWFNCAMIHPLQIYGLWYGCSIASTDINRSPHQYSIAVKARMPALLLATN